MAIVFPIHALLLIVGQVSADDAALAKLATIQSTTAKGERQRQIVQSFERQIVQICDWHFVPRDAFAADLRSQDATVTDEGIDEAYRKLLAEVETVQAEQRKLLTYLIDRYEVQAIYVEGLTDRDMPIFEAIARTLRKVDKRDGETWLRFGVAGQLYVEGKLRHSSNTKKYH